MPKRTTLTFTSENAPKVETSKLYVYYCKYSGKHAFTVDVDIDKLPRRRTDAARIVDTEQHTLKLYSTNGGTKLIRRHDGRVERQLRLAIGRLPIAYRTEPEGQYLYIMDNAVTTYQNKDLRKGDRVLLPPCISRMDNGATQVRLDIEDKSPKVCLVKVCADSVRMHTVSTLGREESAMELINFFAKLLGARLMQVSIQRGSSNRSRMLVIDHLSPEEVRRALLPVLMEHVNEDYSDDGEDAGGRQRPDPAGRNRNDDPEDGGGAEGGFDAQEDKQKKRKAAPRNPRPKLTMATLQGDMGFLHVFQELPRAFRETYQGPGHEQRIFPHGTFDEFIAKLEKLSNSYVLKNELRQLRQSLINVVVGPDPEEGEGEEEGVEGRAPGPASPGREREAAPANAPTPARVSLHASGLLGSRAAAAAIAASAAAPSSATAAAARTEPGSATATATAAATAKQPAAAAAVATTVNKAQQEHEMEDLEDYEEPDGIQEEWERAMAAAPDAFDESDGSPPPKARAPAAHPVPMASAGAVRGAGEGGGGGGGGGDEAMDGEDDDAQLRALLDSRDQEEEELVEENPPTAGADPLPDQPQQQQEVETRTSSPTHSPSSRQACLPSSPPQQQQQQQQQEEDGVAPSTEIPSPLQHHPTSPAQEDQQTQQPVPAPVTDPASDLYPATQQQQSQQQQKQQCSHDEVLPTQLQCQSEDYPATEPQCDVHPPTQVQGG
ncbi:MAG: hypothetical protein WDW38_000515 [Sanguina aurantia]